MNTKNSTSQNYTIHEIIWNLLPWYANNTLDETEKDNVKQHLKLCHLCQDELQSQLILQEKLISSDSIATNNVIAFDNIMSRIDQRAASASNSKASHDKIVSVTAARSIINKFKYNSVPSAIAASFFVAVTIALFFNVSNDGKIYNTLTDSQDNYYSSDLLVSANNSQYLTRIIFNKKTSQSDIKLVLKNFNGIVRTGPDERGIYTIDFSSTIKSNKQYRSLLLTLNEQAEILLVSAIDKQNLLSK